MYQSPHCESLKIKELRQRADELNKIYQTNIKGRSKKDLCEKIQQVQNEYDGYEKQKKEKEKEKNETEKDRDPDQNQKPIQLSRITIPAEHNFNTAKEGLKYLQTITRKFPLSTLCYGIQENIYQNWFEYLIDHHHLSSSVCVAHELNLRMIITKDTHYSISLRQKGILAKGVFDRIRNKINQCSNTSIILPVSITNEKDNVFTSAHLNMVLINTKNKTYEWFEPNGFKESGRTEFNAMTEFLSESFSKLLFITNYTFISAYQLNCPLIFGFQRKSFDYFDQKDCRRKNGYCVTYSTIYAHLRCLVPNATIKETINALADLTDDQIMNLVLRYLSWQVDILKKQPGFQRIGEDF